MNLDFLEITDPKEIEVLRGKTSVFEKLHIQYDEETLTFLKSHLHPPNLYLLVKEANDFAAFCSIDTEWWEEGFFFLREIFIEPKYQHHGIGTELMKRCINHAKQQNAKGVVTETAFENIPMQKLCKKMGFEEWNNPEWKEGITYKLYFI